jgi:NADH-quinone oxidoreductase subunit I
MEAAHKLQGLRDLWSLIRGLQITGDALFRRTVTVHYPRREVGNLASFRGPIELVPRPKEPLKPKCIACLLCMQTCPSGCITVVRMKAPKLTAEQMPPAAGTTGGEKVKKPAAPREPEQYLYDYSLCSLCGLCAEVCPVQSICFSSEVYRVSQRRVEFRMDLLAKLQEQAGALKGSGEKTD